MLRLPRPEPTILPPHRPAQPNPPAPRSLRWLSVVLRGAHQITVVALGAALLGAPLALHASALAVLASGLLLLLLDLITKPGLLLERAGAAVAIKLLLVAWMAADATHRTTLFWLIVGWSTLFAHAPASFRHARWRKAASSTTTERN